MSIHLPLVTRLVGSFLDRQAASMIWDAGASLRGRSIIITGAAGGIGYAVACSLRDPELPYAESIGTSRSLIGGGVNVMVGILNATVAQIGETNEVLGKWLVSVQNQFSPTFGSSLEELRHCAECGAALLPWSPARRHRLRRRRRLRAYRASREIADIHGVSPQQVALAGNPFLTPRQSPSPQFPALRASRARCPLSNSSSARTKCPRCRARGERCNPFRPLASPP